MRLFNIWNLFIFFFQSNFSPLPISTWLCTRILQHQFYHQFNINFNESTPCWKSDHSTAHKKWMQKDLQHWYGQISVHTWKNFSTVSSRIDKVMLQVLHDSASNNFIVGFFFWFFFLYSWCKRKNDSEHKDFSFLFGKCACSLLQPHYSMHKKPFILASRVKHIIKTLMQSIHSRAHTNYNVVWIQTCLLHLPELNMTVELVS